MVLKNVFIAVIGLAALAWSGLSAGQQYRAGEFLHLDLSRAVLSPKPAAVGPLPLAAWDLRPSLAFPAHQGRHRRKLSTIHPWESGRAEIPRR